MIKLTNKQKDNFCESCNNKGYLEVTLPDDYEYIQSCDNCDHFGIIGDRDYRAREAARKDGYKLDKEGKIL